MNLLGYSITKRPYIFDELQEVLESEINCRLLFVTGSTTEETLKAFKQWYTFYKIVKLIENNNNLQLSKDLAEESKKLSLNHFYNTMKAVEAIDHIGQADLRSIGVIARVVKDPQLGFDDIEFTTKC